MRNLLLLILLLSLSIIVESCHRQPDIKNNGVKFETIEFNKNKFDIVRVDLKRANIELFWQTAEGEPFRNFHKLESWLNQHNRRLLAATNAGIFSVEHTPLGLHIEAGQVLQPVNLNDGGGNFFLKPNGIFLIDQQGARIIESSTFSTADHPLVATQSGPLLVLDHKINAKFTVNSANQFVRSGIGVAAADDVYLVISQEPVNFYDFAALFEERLQCANALYLDGTISKLYLPGLKPDADGDFIGIIGVIAR